MRTIPADFRLPLPKSWPNRIRFAVFDQQPTSVAVRTFLGRVIRESRNVSTTLDHGPRQAVSRPSVWAGGAAERSIRQRFGAVGKYGSLAVIERLIRTIKDEGTRKMIIPYRRDAFRRELSLFIVWYNGNRPHTWLERPNSR